MATPDVASAAATVPPRPVALASTGRAVARNSATMAAGSVVGRVTGLLRTIAIGAAIGGALLGNDYALANNLPNMVYELLLGGVLSAAVVPMLVRARVDSDDGGQAYAQRLLTAATVGLAVATALAIAAAPLLTRVIATGAAPADRHLVTVLGYLLLPEIFFYGLAALCGAVLNSRGHFAAPMWTPILNNLVVIATAVLFAAMPSIAHPADPSTIRTSQVLVLGIGT
ncbi:MAG TPA: lipid II flippase MurJ, partial [Nakamurella sp.]